MSLIRHSPCQARGKLCEGRNPVISNYYGKKTITKVRRHEIKNIFFVFSNFRAFVIILKGSESNETGNRVIHKLAG